MFVNNLPLRNTSPYYPTFCMKGASLPSLRACVNRRGNPEKIIKFSYFYRFFLDCRARLRLLAMTSEIHLLEKRRVV